MRDDPLVRTTLDISDEVMGLVRELADARRMTMGAVLSELALRGLDRSAPQTSIRNGVPLLPPRQAGATRPTMKLVNELRDDS
jgi:hypothetical protein